MDILGEVRIDSEWAIFFCFISENAYVTCHSLDDCLRDPFCPHDVALFDWKICEPSQH
jgi:hypothetical protein